MNRRILSQALALLAGLAFVANTHAEGKLKVGDAAPKLQVGQWAQGEPVKEFESGKVYIVEFWATWCPPCVKNIPHLNELQQKYKDKGLVIIGQDLGEGEAKVLPFIEKMGADMTYRVAIDDKSTEPNGAMAKNWMTAAGKSGIPCAFIVDKKGKIAWIDHPASLKEELLEDILADRYNPGKSGAESDAAPEVKKEKKTAPKIRAIVSTKNHQIMSLYQELNTSLREKDWDAADATMASLEKLAPGAPQYGIPRFQILVGRKDYDGAYKMISALSDAHLDNVKLQNDIAWVIATKEGLVSRDLALAEKAAERANEAAKGQAAFVLDTLARVQFMNGKQPEAVATQQKAVELADSTGNGGLVQSLASYKAGKLPDGGN